MAALIMSWLGSVIVTALFAPFVGSGAHDTPLWVRYGSFLASQLIICGSASLVIWTYRARIATLGPFRLPARAIWEALLSGSGLVGLTALYGLALQYLWPSAYQQMVDEQTVQLTWLAAPWPLLWFSAVIVAPICEELMYRGVVFSGLRRAWGLPAAAVASAILFAAVHLMPLSLVPLFAIGLASALLYARHRSLLVSLVLHAAYNALSLLLG